MKKIKVYATSTGDKNSYMLLEVGNLIPPGYTEEMPPEPVEGYKVTWNPNSNEWQQVEIPPENGAIE